MNLKARLNNFLNDGDVLLVVPPFVGLDRPSLAVHILQACARRININISVLYANLLLAARIGEEKYTRICYGPVSGLMGERFFSAAAYGPRQGFSDSSKPGSNSSWRMTEDAECKIGLSELIKLESAARPFIEDIAGIIARRNFKVVGCTTTFEQTSASVALLNRIKQISPEMIALIGGANCEGEMSEGIASLNANIDYIFSGESELSFCQFLKQILSGAYPSDKIIYGEPCIDLEGIPVPIFTEFYEQFDCLIANGEKSKKHLWLPYESSRGCWWGQKEQCTFCGINGETIKFREKSPDTVLSELKKLLSEHPSKKICMVDNIMPYTYFRTLLPRIEKEIPSAHIFYEQKANLTLSRISALKKAGVAVIQPGIESLSSSLLKRMNKGVSAHQNIKLLRYARSADLSVNWNVLWGFPGDKIHEYEEMLNLLPLLRHLNPPTGLFHLSIDRFSPYFNRPKDFGITNIRPIEEYKEVFPQFSEISKIAYHFEADYDSESHKNTEIIQKMQEEIDIWRFLWNSEKDAPPMLALTMLSKNKYLLLDTRSLPDTREIQFLDYEQASIALVGRPFVQMEGIMQALQLKIGVKIDSNYVPLVTAAPDLLNNFENELLNSEVGATAN